MGSPRRKWLRALTGLLLACCAPPAGAEVLRDVPYVPDAGPDRSLDLFLPADPEGPPPLIAFVHSRFWARRDGGRRLVGNFARPLQREGVAVAIVRHRLAPEHVHPEQARDVAAAVAFLIRNAARYGYDPQRIFLAGHSSGGQLAALVGLDRSYLGAVDVSPDVLAGVIVISGVFDLEDTQTTSEEEQHFVAQAFPSPEARRQASPLHHVRADAPPFLVIAAGDDIPSVLPGSRNFADALRASGHERTEGMLVKSVDHFSILDFSVGDSATMQAILKMVNAAAASD